MLTPKKPSLMSDPSLILVPGLLVGSLSISEALLLQQIYYWCKKTCITDEEGERILCYTYEQWQKQLPFVSKKWLMKMVKNLEANGWIEVERGASYNRYRMGKATKDPQYAQCFSGKLILNGDDPIKVFPRLAVEIGLVEAIVLQTLHIRTYKKPDWWVKKTVRQWHDDLLPFVSVRTLERSFNRLRKLGVLASEKVTNKGHNSTRLRVNYPALASVLSVSVDGESPKIHPPAASCSLSSANTSPVAADSSPSIAISSPLV